MFSINLVHECIGGDSFGARKLATIGASATGQDGLRLGATARYDDASATGGDHHHRADAAAADRNRAWRTSRRAATAEGACHAAVAATAEWTVGTAAGAAGSVAIRDYHTNATRPGASTIDHNRAVGVVVQLVEMLQMT